jgi:hypothetical protein
MLPVMSPTVLVGDLPGSSMPCELVVSRGGYERGQTKFGLGVILESGAQWEHATVRITPASPRKAVFVGGFPVFEPQGVQELGPSDREGFELAQRLADRGLRPQYDVIVGSPATQTPDLPDVAASWLLDPGRAGRAALVADGSTLALMVEGGQLETFSTRALDDFCASVTVVAQAFGCR